MCRLVVVVRVRRQDKHWLYMHYITVWTLHAVQCRLHPRTDEVKAGIPTVFANMASFGKKFIMCCAHAILTINWLILATFVANF